MPLRPRAGFVSAFYDPLKNPNAPTIGTATKGDTSVSVSFTPPTNVGGSAITGYVVAIRKTSDGTSVGASGTSSPITVTGLTNGTAYTATVAAVNSYGPSASSAASNSVTPNPLAIGDAYQGGFFVGQISTNGSGVANFNLVIGPVSSAQSTDKQWKNANTDTAGANLTTNGTQNTADMVAEGNATVYPAAHFCNDLVIGGYSDWYMPAKSELEICYFNLKPTTAGNNTSGSTNPYAVPPRNTEYTSVTPAPTSVAAFQSGGPEAFSPVEYWTSMEANTLSPWAKGFSNGNDVNQNGKEGSLYVRAMRRVPV